MRRIFAAALVCLALALLAAPALAHGNAYRPGVGGAGDLDPGFGSGGKQSITFQALQPVSAHNMAVQSDGKIVVAGSADSNYGSRFLLLRYNVDGTLDSTFGQLGRVLRDLPTSSVGAANLAIAPDGKIVVGATVYSDAFSGSMSVWRFNADGSPDTGFGSGGNSNVSFDASSSLLALALAADGKIVLAGTTGYRYSSSMAVARLNADGSLDSSFSGSGKRTIPFPGATFGSVYSVLLPAAGRIILVGQVSAENNTQLAAVQLDNAGNIDPSFGGGPFTVGFSGRSSQAVAATLAPGGKIIITARLYDPEAATADQIGLVRLTAAGALDPTFGTGGKVITDLGSQAFGLSDVAALPDGGAVVAGYISADPQYKPLLIAYTPSGALNTAFGSNGKRVVNVNSTIAALERLNDGKLLLAGTLLPNGAASRIALFRFSPTGSRDTTFGNAGVASPQFILPTTSQAAAALALPNGQFLVAGSANQAFALLRLNGDGSLDTSFGVEGYASNDLDQVGGSLKTMLRDANGKILLGGFLGAARGMVLLRYNADGTPDKTFGNAGRAPTAFDRPNAASYAATIQPDGKIVQVGWAQDALYTTALVRYNSDGSLDTTFGTGGQVQTSLGTSSWAVGVATAADGKLYVLSAYQYFDKFALLRYNSDGSLDNSFGTNGVVVTAVPGLNSLPARLIMQPDGRLLAYGIAAADGQHNTQLVLIRYMPDGSLDPGFGNAGVVLTDSGGNNASGNDLTLQPDGKIVAVGRALIDNLLHSIVMRYNPDGSPDTSFGGGVVRTILGTSDEADAVTILPDGRIVVAGTVLTNPSTLAIAAYLGSTAAPTPTSGPGCILADVCPGDYWFTPVQKLIARGAISGYGDNTFRPFSNATRGQVAKIVVLAAGWQQDDPAQPSFVDVPRSDPFYKFVETAVAHAVISGYSSGRFYPYNEITRGQLSKVIVLATGWQLVSPATPHFGDVPPGNAFFSYVETAYAHGAISGYADGTFRWASTATRAQIAKFVDFAISPPAQK